MTAACAGCNNAAGEGSEPLRVHVFPGAFISLPEYVAVAEGFFEDAGVDVELVPIAAGNDATAALAAGRIDIINNSTVNTVRLIAQDQDLVAIGATMQSPSITLVAGPDWSVPSEASLAEAAESLEGARVGVSARGAEVELDIRALLIENDVDPDAVTYIPTGFGAPMVAALKSGQIDVAASIDPGTTLMSDIAGATVIADFRGGQAEGSVVSSLPAGLRYTSSKFLGSREEDVNGYNAAIDRAIDMLTDENSETEVVADWGDAGEIDPTLAAKVLDANRATWGSAVTCEQQLSAVTDFFTLLEDPIRDQLDSIDCADIYRDKGLFE
jgi:NitT/TauT family transport system substrate-binding protein